ncbi:MAG TPA: lysophospholipid acyltransferase family protein [Anaeromyxobacter sp.]|nr:lysophospholipid acyltransferase family protein [Anaeromyxobacter sp.]
MAGPKKRAKPRRARTGTVRNKQSRPARAVLGNDPFARGAAPRAPAAQASAPTPPPPKPVVPPTPQARPPAAAPSAAAPAREEPAPRLASVERRVEAAIEQAEARLVELAGRARLRDAPEELWSALAGVVPKLQAGIAAALDLVRLLEPPERLDKYGMDARFDERFAPVAELLYSTWWRTVVREAGHVPARGPAVVVANHAGVVPWDALVLREALRRDHPAHRPLRPLLDDRECDLPLLGPMFVRLGAVRASPQAAEALLSEGQLVGVFPEGSAGARKPWRERYRLQRFGRGGFVKLALRMRAPIVPCAIVGSEEASSGISRAGWLAERLGVPLIGKGAALRFGPAAALPLPSRWSLRFGPPVPLDGRGPADAQDPAIVNVLTERVRATLQAMLEEDLGARGSVFL